MACLRCNSSSRIIILTALRNCDTIQCGVAAVKRYDSSINLHPTTADCFMVKLQSDCVSLYFTLTVSWVLFLLPAPPNILHKCKRRRGALNRRWLKGSVQAICNMVTYGLFQEEILIIELNKCTIYREINSDYLGLHLDTLSDSSGKDTRQNS